jgi:3-oxoadipate enol-lactonase
MPLLPLNDTEIYYEVHGDGQPLLFLSETHCDGEVWKIYQVPEFSKNYQVITMDYRGTGRSGKPSVPFTTELFAQDAVALLDHLQSTPAIVCGHSMGGRIAQLLAAKYPDKIKKLILASTGPAYPSTKGIPLKIATEMVEWGYEKYVREHSILVGFTPEFVKQYPDRVENYLQVRMANMGPIEFYFRHLMARQGHDTSALLKDIVAPTLILVGEDDRNVTSDISHRTSSELLEKGIPDAKLVVLSGERHSYFFANPEAAHAAIHDFLS